MKAVILAGGAGTRISEETNFRPKPMVEIGGMPILWHIMKTYSQHGINDFVICLGYKGYLIKEFFANYLLHTSDVTIDIQKNDIQIHHHEAEPWRVTLVETGEKTMTGGRIKRIEKYVDGTFCLTYGDGLSNVNIEDIVQFHQKNKLLGTITGVKPIGRFGVLQIEKNKVVRFEEKPSDGDGWINGGFFVFETGIFDYIKDDQTIFEREPLEKLSQDGQLGVYLHDGFWQPMDTLRDKTKLEELWVTQKAPWKNW
ncbi:MAG: glucose-1-phosphate cytidylyltransferase [Nitrosotalea sp.]